MVKATNDKVVLIVGATSGIGKAAALGFAEEGYKVALAARREIEGYKIATAIKLEGGEAIFIETDVSDVVSISPISIRWDGFRNPKNKLL
ncbi:MAG: SDR family NAD(P)-dependent oxidoreductase [Cyanobacteria bacterium J06626_18]